MVDDYERRTVIDAAYGAWLATEDPDERVRAIEHAVLAWRVASPGRTATRAPRSRNWSRWPTPR